MEDDYAFIFRDENDMPIKFFFQKDILGHIQASMYETVTELGGMVMTTIPRNGFILVAPGTLEEDRLRQCWASSSRPGRFFVPYTYVDACKAARVLLHQIFVKPSGDPIPMHIHDSITHPDVRSTVISQIQHSGGNPGATFAAADVVIGDPYTDAFWFLVEKYREMSDKRIESYIWIDNCIDREVLAYTNRDLLSGYNASDTMDTDDYSPEGSISHDSPPHDSPQHNCPYHSPLFHDLKIFIQKDIPRKIQATISKTVRELGGQVLNKIPREGIVVVVPGTFEGARLRQCWTSSSRPGRFFVPSTYVEACKAAGTLLRQIFVQPNGRPIQMHIHASITQRDVRSTVSSQILHSGGNPDALFSAADVFIANPDTDAFWDLVEQYQDEPDKYVESYHWVKNCIVSGVLEYTDRDLNSDNPSQIMDTDGYSSDGSASDGSPSDGLHQRAIFQNEDGTAVKFFIQYGLPDDIQMRLVKDVTQLGGSVERFMPKKGFILVDPMILISSGSVDRSERLFVPYTFVDACKEAGKIIPQIFMEEHGIVDLPIAMHIHESIANPELRSTLTTQILNTGGDPTASLELATVIVADPFADAFEQLVQQYQDMSYKHVESFLWVLQCIQKGALKYSNHVHNPS